MSHTAGAPQRDASIHQTRAASVAEKISAVRVECKLKHQALRDTQIRNHYLHKQVSDVHSALEQADREAKVEEERIAKLQRRMMITQSAAPVVNAAGGVAAAAGGGGSGGAHNLDETASVTRHRDFHQQTSLGSAVRGGADGHHDHKDGGSGGGAGTGSTEEAQNTTIAVLERYNIAPLCGKPVPLADLERVAAQVEQQVAEAYAENEVAAKTLQRLRERQATLEDDVKRQLARNEKLNKECGRAKSLSQRQASLAREENVAVIQLERRLRAVQESCASLHSEERAHLRHNKKLQEKLSAYRKEMECLVSQRTQARTKALGTASEAEQRDDRILTLREENARLVEYLLNEQKEMQLEERGTVASHENGDGGSDVDETGAAAAALGEAASERRVLAGDTREAAPCRSSSAPARNSQSRAGSGITARAGDAEAQQRREVEGRLLSELQQALEIAGAGAQEMRKRASHLLRSASV